MTGILIRRRLLSHPMAVPGAVLAACMFLGLVSSSGCSAPESHGSDPVPTTPSPAGANADAPPGTTAPPPSDSPPSPTKPRYETRSGAFRVHFTRQADGGWQSVFVADGDPEFQADGGWSRFWINATWTDPTDARWVMCADFAATKENFTAHREPPACSPEDTDAAAIHLHDFAHVHAPAPYLIWMRMMDSQGPAPASVAIDVQWVATIEWLEPA
jgi:hypothetical protein